jgi:hypothetical protein
MNKTHNWHLRQGKRWMEQSLSKRRLLIGSEDFLVGALQESNKECKKTQVKAHKMHKELQEMLADWELKL